MHNSVNQILDWSEWGQQWVDYLMHKRKWTPERKKELQQFSRLFSRIGKKASQLLYQENEEEISRLALEVGEVRKQFRSFLRLVSEKPPGHGEAIIPVSMGPEPAPVARPVPIGKHQLPPLPYDYAALEPYIDRGTMRIHHDILHRRYVENLNKAEDKLAEARKTNNFDLVKHWERELAFNGAGHYLHTLFWNVMSPTGGGQPRGELADQLIRDYGSIEAFRRQFSQAADKVEGSGWAILAWSPRAQRTEILQAEKHQNLTQWESIPLLALDVWEHAYFLQYGSDRMKYIDAWWNIVNWPYVQDRYLQARRLRWQPY